MSKKPNPHHTEDSVSHPHLRKTDTTPTETTHEKKHHKKQSLTSSSEGCLAKNCKHPATHFHFCNTHYEYFKFGLIKKTGEPVSDYEKKFEHYTLHKLKHPSHGKKVA